LIIVILFLIIFLIRSFSAHQTPTENTERNSNNEYNAALIYGAARIVGLTADNVLVPNVDNFAEAIDELANNEPVASSNPIREPVVFCGSADPDNAATISDDEAMSYLVIVNNCYRLSSAFSPDDLSVVNVESMHAPNGSHHYLRETAARAAEELFQAAAADNIYLIATSGYRSYDSQTFFHNNAIQDFGIEEARARSAVPGHSEHQLGLALDLSTHELGGALVQTFIETPEGIWVNQNAHRFGFILSYPNGREEDTGIMYEPWHIRYVGVAEATEIFDNDMILEEFLWYELPELNAENESESAFESEVEESEEAQIRIQFAGDIFLHQGPMDVARTGERTYDFRPFFTHIQPFINGDLTIANMEVPVDAHGGNEQLASFPLFNAPFEILDGLQYAGFNHLISANNHAFDQGFEGLINTVYSFERAGIDHTGMNRDLDDYNTPTLLDVDGIKVGIIAYTDSVNGEEWRIPDASLAYAVRRFRSDTLDDISRMTQDMADLREAGAEFVIVALHWGAEYGDEPVDTQRLIARDLIDAGADVIMGKHSHTVHPVEWHYREDGSRGFIMYSLGNFMADQTRLTAASVSAQIATGTDNLTGMHFAGRTQFGMLVSLEVSRDTGGEIRINTADVLPTLCVRDFSGNTLGTVDGVSVMPLVGGEMPDFVTDAELRNWGVVAYEHVQRIAGSGDITITSAD